MPVQHAHHSGEGLGVQGGLHSLCLLREVFNLPVELVELRCQDLRLLVRPWHPWQSRRLCRARGQIRGQLCPKGFFEAGEQARERVLLLVNLLDGLVRSLLSKFQLRVLSPESLHLGGVCDDLGVKLQNVRRESVEMLGLLVDAFLPGAEEVVRLAVLNHCSPRLLDGQGAAGRSAGARPLAETEACPARGRARGRRAEEPAARSTSGA
mmetsp:Transcript_72410/g.200795  ORF Transcript_72410/g.200795 Transcript_72410/m.200795 type:complete len:209 (-) Transcript_72410:49-675(-)